MKSPVRRKVLTPPEVAAALGITTVKVIAWIRTGELRALNLAHRGCTRPRYAVTEESLAEFERSRQVIPDGGESTTARLRRQNGTSKNYFA